MLADTHRMPSRRTGPVSLALAGLLALLLSSCGQAPPPAAKAATLVTAQAVQLVDYAGEIALSGEIRAQTEVGLGFRTGGRIAQRFVDVGDHVLAGQILARLDPAEQQADVDAAQATVAAAEAQVQQASAALDRQKTLLGQGVTTRSQVDQAQTAFDSAQASQQAAEAQLATAKEALGYTVLKAETNGIVTARNGDVGEIAAAAQAIFTLAVDGGRDAVFGVQESAFLSQPDTDSIDVVLISDPSIKAHGKIREVSPTIDASTGTVQIKIAIDNPPPQMTLGAAVTGTAREMKRQAMVLPASALWSSGAAPAVWVIDPASHIVSLKPVTIASYTTNSVVIGGGLAVGDQVVIAGGKLLHPGQEVTTDGGAS